MAKGAIELHSTDESRDSKVKSPKKEFQCAILQGVRLRVEKATDFLLFCSVECRNRILGRDCKGAPHSGEDTDTELVE